MVAAIAHIRCAALLLPARTTMLTTYGSRGPVLACLRAQATAFWGLSLNEPSDALMAIDGALQFLQVEGRSAHRLEAHRERDRVERVACGVGDRAALRTARGVGVCIAVDM